ncbi:MAG: ABC transporter permease subunit [Acidimicrobiia bacterium]
MSSRFPQEQASSRKCSCRITRALTVLRNVFTKDLWDRRRSMIWWVIGMFAMTAWLVAFYPVIRDSQEMQDFLADFPPELLAMFGIDPATFLTGAGYLQGQLYSFIAPIIVIAFTVMAGVGATAKEERAGTMDMLLSLPQRRSGVILQKAASLALLSFVIVASIAVVLLALNNPLELKLSIEGIAAVSAGLWLLGLVFGGVAMLIGAFTGNPTTAGGVAAAAAVLAWAVNAFSSLFSWLEWPSNLSPFSWYLQDTPLINGRSTGQIWLALAVIGLIAGATFLFMKRNIATEQAVIPEAAAAKKKTKSVRPRRTSLLRSVFGKSLWDRRRSVWVWGLGLGSILYLTFAAWPALAQDSDSMQAVMDAMPRELMAMFGLTDPQALATAAGFVSSRTYGSVGPVVLIVFTLTAMTSLVAKEESSGIMDMVLSNPVKRRNLLSEKSYAITVLTGIVVAVLLVIGVISNAAYETDIELLNMVAANIGLGLLGLCFWGIAIALWSLIGAGAAVGVTAAFGVVAWFVNGLGSFVDFLMPFRWISPFFWYLGDTVPLAKGFTFGYLALAVVAVAGTAIAAARFQTKDLAV